MSRIHHWASIGVLSVGAMLGLSDGAAQASPMYALTDLGIASRDYQSSPVVGGFFIDGNPVIHIDAGGQIVRGFMNLPRLRSGGYVVENGVPDALFGTGGKATNPIVAPPGHPGNWSTFAFGINNSGTVAGVSFDGVAMEHGKALVYTSSGGPQLIPTLDGTNGAALGINDLGQVVGQSRLPNSLTDQPHAFLWGGGSTAQDLNLLIASGSGLTLLTATGINGAGQVVGLAVDSQNIRHEFLLAPLPANTPEPTALAAWALVALGYGGRALARRAGEHAASAAGLSRELRPVGP